MSDYNYGAENAIRELMRHGYTREEAIEELFPDPTDVD